MKSVELEQLYIPEKSTLRDALLQMDRIDLKQLIIVDSENKFINLLRIEDIEKSIISNKSLTTFVGNISPEIIIAISENDKPDYIKKLIIDFKLVYVPIIDKSKNVKKLLFAKDIFSDNEAYFYESLNLPVVIMAGGFGKRLKPLTNILPKPLFPYNESTILENIIINFKKYNCSDFIVSLNYKSSLIKFYFNQIENKNYSIQFIEESFPMGTIGSLSLLKCKFTTSFIVSNCDILIDADYSSIYKYHKKYKNELTMVASIKNYDLPYGVIKSGVNGSLITFEEKPKFNYMVNCGMYIMEPHLLSEIPNNKFYDITDLIEKIQSRKGKIGVFPISENSWKDLGNSLE